MEPPFETLEEARHAWRNERAARDGWIRRAESAEREVAVYSHMVDKLLAKLGSPATAPELSKYCTKHQLHHGQKYKSCRVRELLTPTD